MSNHFIKYLHQCRGVEQHSESVGTWRDHCFWGQYHLSLLILECPVLLCKDEGVFLD